MISLGDITKLLEQIPTWKKLKVLPGRVDALSERMDALERQLRDKPSKALTCPQCEHSPVKVLEVVDDPDFGPEIKYRRVECPECGYQGTLPYEPHK